MKNIFGDNHGLDEKSMAFIANAIEKANLPGFDYVEFKQAISNMAKMNLDDATAYKTAFATAMTLGLTKDKLLETANHYKTVLVREKEQFDKALLKQEESRIGDNLKKVDEYKNVIADNELKMKELQAAIDNARAKMRELDYERNQSQQKIEEAKSKFVFTHRSIMNLIEKDIENIGKYI
jgi:chromosome segregation ATPase